MKNRMMKIFALALLSTQLASCGSNTDNIDILNSTTFPSIGSFASTPTYGSGTGYSSVSPYILFNTVGFGAYVSPARGIVSEFGISNLPGFAGTYYLTIIHSGRVATRVHGLQPTLNVRPGDAVFAGSIIGNFFSTSQVAFQVLLDGTPVCPLSFLNSSMRQQIFNNPCLQ